MNSAVRLALLSGAFVCGAILEPSAAELAFKGPVSRAHAAASWTGPYLAAYAGWSWGQGRSVTTIAPAETTTRFDGFIAGAAAGYDYQFANNVVIGARLAAPIYTSAQGGGVSKTRWAALAEGMLGYAVGDFLPYIGGGAAFASVQIEQTILGTPTTRTRTHTGYSLFAGAKYRLAESWALGVEYRYAKFGNRTYDFPLPTGPMTVDFSVNTIAATIDYRF